jgi:AcrR family transcriptional regulator
LSLSRDKIGCACKTEKRMTTQAMPKARRNRPQTEARLRAAIGALLAEGGFAALTPSAVGKRAGVDKMLIYRYFGDLNGLVEAVARAPDFFPSLKDICGGDPEAFRRIALPERLAAVFSNFAKVLMERPSVVEMMVWELVERNELTAIMETAREEMGVRIAVELFPDAPTDNHVRAIAALLSAGVNYLVLRRRKIRWYNGVDLKSDEGWRDLHDAMRAMAEAIAWSREERSSEGRDDTL